MKNAARAAAAMLALSFTFTILAGCAKTPSDSSFPDSSVSDEIPDADSSGELPLPTRTTTAALPIRAFPTT